MGDDWTPHVSPTAIDTFRECKRKLAFRWHDKRENLSAFRGKCGHSILEAYGKDKTPPEIHEANLTKKLVEKYAEELAEKGITAEEYASRIIATVNKMIPHLPEPPWPSTEEAISFELDGVHFVGRVDLQPDGETILDHKFTGSPEFIKRAEDLLTDPQAVIYAWWRMNHEQIAASVDLKWLYGVVGAKARAKLVKQTMPYEHVREQMQPLVEIGKEIVRLRLLDPDPLSLEPTWSSCERFGGCPYQDQCQPTAENMIEAFLGKDEKKMGVISNLKNKGKTEEKKQERTDDGHAKAECSERAKTLLDLGMSREEVLKTLQKKYVGLPADVISACLPPLEEKKEQAINPPDLPKTEPEEKAAKGKKASGKASATDPKQVALDRLVAMLENAGIDQTVSIAHAICELTRP